MLFRAERQPKEVNPAIREAADRAIAKMQLETASRAETLGVDIFGSAVYGGAGAWLFGPLVGAGMAVYWTGVNEAMHSFAKAQEALKEGKWGKAFFYKYLGVAEMTIGHIGAGAGIGGTLGSVPGAIAGGAAFGLGGLGFGLHAARESVPVGKVKSQFKRR